jgi:hypothetical protein
MFLDFIKKSPNLSPIQKRPQTPAGAFACPYGHCDLSRRRFACRCLIASRLEAAKAMVLPTWIVGMDRIPTFCVEDALLTCGKTPACSGASACKA